MAVLRRDLGFAGIVFSDDLSMGASLGMHRLARGEGWRPRSPRAATPPLLMNDRAALVRVLDGWRPGEAPATRNLGPPASGRWSARAGARVP